MKGSEMPDNDLEIKPVEWFSCTAIGKPGERTFFIKARGNDREVALLVEKVQLQTLVVGFEELINDIREKYPHLPEARGQLDAEAMKINPPVDPLYRVGEVGLAYAEDEDLAIILFREILTTQQSQDNLRVVRLWTTRSQIIEFSEWAKMIINSGRQLCPQCREPMDPEGHLCPKKNGHRK